MNTIERTQDQAIVHLIEAVRHLCGALAREPGDRVRSQHLRDASERMLLADHQLNGARES